jgi:2'-5' RNA ligase
MPPVDASEDRADASRICFVAIGVPQAVGESIARWVAPHLEGPARPVKPDRFHVTLVYYGAVAVDTLAALKTEIGVCTVGAPLELEPASPGRFGRGHVLWMGVGGDVARLAALRRQLFTATSDFGKVSSAEPAEGPESEYVPHITVARLRGRSRAPRRFFESVPEWDSSVRFVADRLTLFESAGGRYRVLAEFPLDGPPG